MRLRACEIVDPRAIWGRPWGELRWAEQVELLAYAEERALEGVREADSG
jgi:hypothetical protein